MQVDVVFANASDGLVEINVALARAFGLETRNLKGFTLVVEPSRLPVVTARYGVLDQGLADEVRRIVIGDEPAKAA